MNGFLLFMIGYLLGICSTYIGIMTFTKYMNNRDLYINMGKKKYGKC